MGRWRLAVAALALLLAAGSAGLAWRSHATEAEIDALREAARRQAEAHPPAWPDPASMSALPAPVRRWVAYTFPAGPAVCWMADVRMQGRFRRPQAEAGTPTTARQRIAGGTPALVFDARTPLSGPIEARAFDAYVYGHMTMRVRLLSSITVVGEAPTPALDAMSLRRWLLESAMCPNALLPGGPVHWEPLDARHARAVVRHQGMQACLRATFDGEGRLVQFDAESDGDLTLPYHGSGERVERSDFRLVQRMRVPHRFVVSRVAGGRVWPFWEGEVEAVELWTAPVPR